MANTAQNSPIDAPGERATTLGELKASGYRSRSVKEELRQNLIGKLETGEPLFEGIVGFEETVVPMVENAILSGQDIIFLGERGQAKTRLARTLPTLLDDWLPIVRRYGEKLATPDITIADLIGEVDSIKVAEGRYRSDALTSQLGLSTC